MFDTIINTTVKLNTNSYALAFKLLMQLKPYISKVKNLTRQVKKSVDGTHLNKLMTVGIEETEFITN